MRKKILWTLAVLIAISGLIGLRIYGKRKLSGNTVRIAVASKGDIKSYLSTTGSIKSKNIKDYFGSQGKVNTVNVKVGDKVSKGQVLVQFETQDVQSAVRQAEIQYNNAVLQKQDTVNQRNQINSKISDLDTEISILESSQSPSDQAQLQSLKQQRSSIQPISNEKIQELDNSIALAKVSLDAARQKAAQYTDNISADMDGVVTALNVQNGGVYSGAQPAVTMQDINDLEAVVALGKYDANKVSLSQEAIVKNGNKQYRGKVFVIDPTANRAVSAAGAETTLNVYINIIDRADNLKVGFDADVDILLGEVKDALKIPAEAIKTDKNGNNLVYVIQGNKAVETPVKLGLQSDIEAQILQGIKEGDKVILNPGTSITNGSTVKI
jgi:HlyD family secretion protein